MKIGIGLLIILMMGAVTTRTGVAGQPSGCRADEPVNAEPPPDPEADAFGNGPWFVNADRTIWAWSGPRGWTASPKGIKVLWIRPPGTNLTVTGKRLDEVAPPLSALPASGYTRSFQPTQIFVPSPGCWEISASAGPSRLLFVTMVK